MEDDRVEYSYSLSIKYFPPGPEEALVSGAGRGARRGAVALP